MKSKTELRPFFLSFAPFGLFLILLGCNVGWGRAFAAGAPATPAATAPSDAAPSAAAILASLGKQHADATLLAELGQLLGPVDAPGALNDADKAKWQDYRKDAMTQLDAAQHWALKSADSIARSDSAPARLDQLRQQLAATSSDTVPIPAAATLAELEQKLTDRQALLAKAQEALVQAEDEIKRRAGRRIEIPKLAAAANSRLEELERLLNAPPPGDVPDELAAMNRAVLLAEKLARRAEIESYQKELLEYDATAEIVPLERDKAARLLHHEERTLHALRAQVDQRRTQDAEQSAQRARAALEHAAKAHPTVRFIATENARLAQQRMELAEKLQKMTVDVEHERTASGTLLRHFKDLQAKDGLTEATDRGVLLYKQIKLLPDEHQLEHSLRSTASQLAEAQLALLELAAKRSELADPERVIANLLNEEERSERTLVWTLQQYLETKRETLDALLQTYNQYMQQLTLLQTHWEELIKKTREYREYIAERVLWIRSSSPLGIKEFRGAESLAEWLGDVQGWRSAQSLLLHDAAEYAPFYLIAALGCAALLVTGRRMRARIREVGEIAARGRTDTFHPTAIALVFTNLVAVAWLAVPGFLAWRLTRMAGAAPDSHGRALGWALLITVLVSLPLELLRQVCRPLGLAEAHFDWPRHGITLLRRSLRQLMILALPLVLVTSMLHMLGNDDWDSSIGRVAFILMMFVSSRFLWQALNPSGGVVDEVLSRDEGGWLNRLRWVWFPVSIGAPLALAALAAAGFYYTAIQLVWRLEATLALLLALLLTHSLLLRLLIVVRRRLAIEQARQRRSAHIENRDSASDANDASLELERLDLAIVSQQTRHLLQSAIVCAAMVGMCAVWLDVLPALKKLNEFELWKAAAKASATAGSATATSITLGNVLGALLIGMMTFLGARNIPGLVEISILQRLPLRAGSGYAITTICRYCIVLIGVVWAAGQVGLQWSQVQWLVAAVSVGLGFGLQEIFGNFISGLIILFERPIRVGDTITVGQLSGTVSRIRMRATTVLDGDRKELIIPNKEFITGQVINWTLSDEIIRLVIRLHVEFGTDILLAQRLILKAAQEHPNVLKDPAPSAFLDSLVDHSLEFQLCVFLPSLAGGSRTRHELLETIARGFQAAGIQVAPPVPTVLRRRSA